MSSTRPRHSARAPAQNLVEYGVIVAAVMLVFFVGLSALTNGEAGYLAGAVTKPDPTAIAGLPLHGVQIDGSCNPPPSPVYTGQAFACTLTLSDPFTGGPAQVPLGALAFDGTGNFTACNLVAISSSSSRCTFSFTPTQTREQAMTANFTPSSNHLAQSWTLGTSIYAIDKTHFATFSCTASVPLAEPARCTASVLDEFTNQLISGVPVRLTTTAPGGANWTFSGPFTLAPRWTASPYDCITTGNAVTPNQCVLSFRADASTSSEGSYSIAAAYDRDADHEAAPPVPPQVVNVGGPSTPQHLVSLALTCSGPSGRGSTRASPLQVSLADFTTCRLSVTDTKPSNGNGDPTGVTPTGQVTWSMESVGPGGTGTISPGTTCALQKVTENSSQCPAIRYTPTEAGTPDGPDMVNTHQIIVTYDGDLLHAANEFGIAVYVRDV